MAGIALCHGGETKQILFAHALCGTDFGDREAALGEGAGLIHRDNLSLCKGFQIVAALDQNTAPGGGADTAEEAQRNGDDQRTGAGNDQEDQCTMYPVKQRLVQDQRRDKGDKQCRKHDTGGIPVGKTGDEVLGFRLLVAGILHQIEDLGNGGFAELLGDADGQQAGHVDTAADHFAALGNISGNGFTGQRGGINGGAAFQHNAIQRDALAGTDINGISGLDCLGIHLGQLTVHHDVGVIGTDIHQLCNGTAGTAHRIALEPFTDLEQQHNHHTLGKLAGKEGAEGGKGHQEFLIEQLAV